jgi:hypothetical protein
MNRTYWALDRFEEEYAVLTAPDGAERQIPRSAVSPDAREGMQLYEDAASGLYCPDAAETAARGAALRARMAALLARGKEKDANHEH